MNDRKENHQRSEISSNIVNEILTADLDYNQKIKYLEFTALYSAYYDQNLIYLEAKQAIEELNEQEVNRNNKA